MTPRIIEDAPTLNGLPFGTKVRDSNDFEFVRIIGGWARRRAGDSPENPSGGQWSADELAYPVEVTHLPETP